MRHTGSQADDRAGALTFQQFLHRNLVLGHIGKDDHVTASVGVADLGIDGHHVQAYNAVLRIVELHFAAQHRLDCTTGDGGRIDRAREIRHHFPQAHRTDIFILETNQCRRSGIGILDRAICIDHQDPILNGIEDRLLHLALTRESLHEDAEIDGIEIFDPPQNFIETGVFHTACVATGSTSAETAKLPAVAGRVRACNQPSMVGCCQKSSWCSPQP